MRILIQRVKKASVTIDQKLYSQIDQGMLVLLGIEESDTTDDIQWLVKKLVNLRIFCDENGIMNIPVTAINGEILLVSQFTLFASTKKGNRSSYIRAARPETAIPLYEEFIRELGRYMKKPVKAGKFGADMQVELINDGPVTIMIDSKIKE